MWRVAGAAMSVPLAVWGWGSGATQVFLSLGGWAAITAALEHQVLGTFGRT